MKLGTPVDVRDLAGQTALHSSARGGSKYCVQKLIDNGAEVDGVSQQPHTAREIKVQVKEEREEETRDNTHNK